MSWVRQALEERAWTKVEIEIAGKSGPAWVRKLSVPEHIRIWSTMAAPLERGAVSDPEEVVSDAIRKMSPEDVERRVRQTVELIVSMVYEADPDTEARTDRPMFTPELIDLLWPYEFNQLAGLVTSGSGLTEEVAAVAEHFPGESG
jgi:hypothetical protein